MWNKNTVGLVVVLLFQTCIDTASQLHKLKKQLSK